MRIDEITGSSPYGASTIAGGNGERMPSEMNCRRQDTKVNMLLKLLQNWRIKIN